ncbi:MAG: hypothetical protein KatS3mg115_1633 [Candidatus Poribacteria bacterium]|nr:MAG: hypothetical protein KatS3mg115_1633 [Candidatus Poribacteria bacterium]
MRSATIGTWEHESPEKLISGLIAAQLSGSVGRYLFLTDRRGLLPEDLRELELKDRLRPVVFYRDPLTFRDALEEWRDRPVAPEDCPVAIGVFRQERPPQEVADLLARASRLTLEPLALLRWIAPQWEWHPRLNLLEGADFWPLLGALLRRREQWQEPLTASNVSLFLAETLLGRSLREKLRADEAVELWEQVEQDERIASFLSRYPEVSEAVQRAIQRATPIEVKLERDPDFVVFLWTMYFLAKHAPEAELLLPQLFDPDTWEKYAVHDAETIVRTCEALIEQEPTSVIAQVRTAERALSEDPQRERLFLSLLGLSGEQRFERALRIASQERVSGYLTQQALQVLVPEIAARPRTLSKTRLQQLERTLFRRHLGARYPAYFTRMHETIALFQSVVRLSQAVERYHAGGYDRRLESCSVEVWTQELYPKLYVPISLNWERLSARTRMFYDLLAGEAADLLEEARRILDRMNLAFARTVQRHYVRWIGQQDPPPHLTVDFLETIFLPVWREQLSRYRQPMAVICLVHGLRWDEWTLLEPRLDALLQKHRRAAVRPLLSLLPSTRLYNTAALILGRFPALSDSGTTGSLLADRLSMEGIPFAGTLSSPHLELPDRQSGVFLVNVYLPGLGIHKTRRTGEIGEEVVEEAIAQLTPLLNSLPPRAGLFFLSNGGVTEVSAPSLTPPAGCVELQRRWLGTGSFQLAQELSGAVVPMNAAAIHLPNPQVAQCLFALPGVWFSTSRARRRAPLLRRRHLVGRDDPSLRAVSAPTERPAGRSAEQFLTERPNVHRTLLPRRDVAGLHQHPGVQRPLNPFPIGAGPDRLGEGVKLNPVVLDQSRMQVLKMEIGDALPIPPKLEVSCVAPEVSGRPVKGPMAAPAEEVPVAGPRSGIADHGAVLVLQ